MLEETDAKLFAVPHGVFELCVGIGRGGAIQVGIDFGGLLLFLGVVAVSFGVGLGTSRLLGSGLRVTVVAIRYIAIANGFGGGGFGVEAALGFLIGMGLGVSFTACSRGAFGFGAFFVNMLHGDFTGVFRGLHDFARQSRKRLLVFMLPAGERVGFVHLVNGFFVA